MIARSGFCRRGALARLDGLPASASEQIFGRSVYIQRTGLAQPSERSGEGALCSGDDR
jgi:hypothetical protein